jgi:Acetyltransferase (GNAT) domain
MDSATSTNPIDWTFETERVRARLVGEGDCELYRALYTDPAVMAQIGVVMSVAESAGVFEKVCRYNGEWPMRARYWRLSDQVSDNAVGILSIIRDVNDPRLIELGLMFLPRWQGLGIGLNVSGKIVDMLMNNRWNLDAGVVIARHAAVNVRVGRLGVALGFENMAPGGNAMTGWRMTRTEWLARHIP